MVLGYRLAPLKPTHWRYESLPGAGPRGTAADTPSVAPERFADLGPFTNRGILVLLSLTSSLTLEKGPVQGSTSLVIPSIQACCNLTCLFDEMLTGEIPAAKIHQELSFVFSAHEPAATFL